MAIKITKLILDKASQKITISAEVESSGEYMTALYIDNQKTFVCKNEPSDSSTKIELNPDGLTESTDVLTITGGVVTKITDFVIDLTKITQGVVSTLNIEKDLIFLFIDDINLDIIGYTITTLYDKDGFYMQILSQMHKDIVTTGCCDLPQAAADLALMYEAFYLSQLVTDYGKTIYYWNELHTGNNISLTSKCNCKS